MNGASRIFVLILLSAVTLQFSGCGGGQIHATSDSKSLQVLPSSASIFLGEAQVFRASITGEVTSQVIWSVNDIVGGNEFVGTISPLGEYHAPVRGQTPATFVIKATAANRSVFAAASLTIAPVAVSISPAAGTVQTGTAQQFTASITGTANIGIIWSVNNVPGGNAALGTVSITGLYTAPVNVPAPKTVTVTATSFADSSKSAAAGVMVALAPAVIAPASAVLQTGATQQFTASVTGQPAATILWSVNEIPGGNSTVGTISRGGFYAAPAIVPAPSKLTVKATSASDPTSFASAAITVVPADTGIQIAIAPAAPMILVGTTLQFGATVSGTNNGAVVWAVNGTIGGNPTVGTISNAGVYTAPATVPAPDTVTLNATSFADPSKSASTTVVITGIALSKTSAVPGEVLAINGNGFDRNAVTSVIFKDAAGNQIPVVTPAVTPSAITVVVPPYPDVRTFQYRAATVSVSVVQTSGGGNTKNFGRAADFQIADLPTVSLPVGTVTVNYLNELQNLLALSGQDYRLFQNSSRGLLGTAKQQSDIQMLQQVTLHAKLLIQQLANGKVASVDLGAFNGVRVTLNRDGLALLDRMLAAYLFQGSVPRGIAIAFGSDASPSTVGDAFHEFTCGVSPRQVFDTTGKIGAIVGASLGVAQLGLFGAGIALGNPVLGIGAVLIGAQLAPPLAAAFFITPLAVAVTTQGLCAAFYGESDPGLLDEVVKFESGEGLKQIFSGVAGVFGNLVGGFKDEAKLLTDTALDTLTATGIDLPEKAFSLIHSVLIQMQPPTTPPPVYVYSGDFTGNVVDQGAGGCPGSATFSGPSEVRVTRSGLANFTYMGSVILAQTAGICDDYSGSFDFSGSISQGIGQPPTITFQFGVASASGTFSQTALFGTWGFSSGNGPDVAAGTFSLTGIGPFF